VAILTTNLEAQIAPALERRLSCRVRFELPDAEGRAAIWRALIPAKAPVGGDVDLDALGRDYALSGGLIRNAVVRAAVAAAWTGGQPPCITMAMLRDAAEHQLGTTRSARPVGFRAQSAAVEHAIYHRIAASLPAARSQVASRPE
jgi:SpoVK/Ycf46/Vps4 family AAA+-type ATPase